ncbi:MAG: rnr [Rhodospirillales bacterium]|nr:rnr [Rhodospirillales bacterium]
MTRGPKREAPFPTREAILAFLRDHEGHVGRREIARAFDIKGEQRVELKALLAQLEREGAIDRGRGKRVGDKGAIQTVGIVEIVKLDDEGGLRARPIEWNGDGPAPLARVATDRRHGLPALGVGDRALAELKRIDGHRWSAKILRKIDREESTRMVGVFETTPRGARIRPTDKRARHDLAVLPANTGGAQNGDIVVAEILPATRLGLRQGKVIERVGEASDARAISLIVIHSKQIPTVFSEASLAQAKAAEVPDLSGREDVRDIPLVTIDGADARDFDDAVWAEPDPDPKNPGGWHLIVAIADVSHYVQPGSPLDRDASERGNSVYFPDRVVPMLPERLSNGLCSLVPGEPRGCLGFHLWIDAHGNLRGHRLFRGLMRSAARLTYEQVQAARDGRSDDVTGPLLKPVIEPLYGAYRALSDARAKRGTLELELPERKVVLGEDGRVAEIAPRERLDSHKLIEEFMITANVAAAEALEAKHAPCVYRVHDAPDAAKLDALRQFLAGIGADLKLSKGQVIRPKHLTQLLQRAAERPEAELINSLVLRSQAQAAYSPANIGHFGLALPRYAHFTSPIRRYADLLVHRSLVKAYGLGPGGLSENEREKLEEIATHISATERTAASAERDAIDRYVASFLSDHVGATFPGRINGVTRFGLFVTLDQSGADGLVPIRTLEPNDLWIHDEPHHRLVGRRSGRVFRLGDRVLARVVEADPIAGSTLFRLVDDPDAPRSEKPASREQPDRPSRPGNRRR